MKKKRFLKSMKITEPCSEPWEDMVGDDRIRFCSHCAKDVNNVSAMTRREALELVRRSKGQLCLRYFLDPQTNTPVFAGGFTQIVRRAPRVAASVMTASLSLSAMAYAQGGSSTRPSAPDPVEPPAAEVSETQVKTDEPEPQKTGIIRGLITDMDGAVLAQAELKLYRKGTDDEVASIRSDYDGTYKFEGLAEGRYRIQALATNLAEQSLSLRISAGEDRVADMTLNEVVIVSGAARSIIRKDDVPALISAVITDEIELVSTLLAAGEDANIRDEDDGRTAIFEAVDSGHVELVRLLLQFGAKVDVEDDDKVTPLMLIDEYTPLELVELLLKNGGKVNAVAKDGNTALINAAHDAKPEVLKALLDAGADINAQNEEGVSALMNAADADNVENVKLLVLAGADVNLKDQEGDNAWDYTGEDEIEAFLVAHGIELDAGEAAGVDYEVRRWIDGDFDEPAEDEPRND